MCIGELYYLWMILSVGAREHVGDEVNKDFEERDKKEISTCHNKVT